jgi:hypothetical protein
VNVDFQYHKTQDSVTVDVTRTGSGDCWIEFSPAFSLRTKIESVSLNGRRLPFKIEPNGEDQHVSMRVQVSSSQNQVVIRMKNDFGLALANELPPLGSTSHGLRVISSSWNSARDQLTLEVSGVPGIPYEFAVWNPEQVSSVSGGALSKRGKIRIVIPAEKGQDYSYHQVVIRFAKG